MPVTVINTTRGIHVHRAGCADLARGSEYRHPGVARWDVDAHSLRAVVLDLYDPECFEDMAEDGSNWRDFTGDLKVFPCVELPDELPDEPPASEDASSLPAVTLPLVTAIDHTWSVIRRRHPDVPAVVVTLGSGSLGERAGRLRYGHFAAGRWQVGEDQAAELFIGGEGLKRGPHDVLATLLHEAAHGVAATRRIQDTSRQGRYHNRQFKALAEELGITVTNDPSIGWSPSTLAEGTAEQYAEQLEELAAALVAYRHPEPRGGRDKNKTAGNGVAATCQCDPPRRIRVRSEEMFDLGPIVCGICEAEFTADEGEGR